MGSVSPPFGNHVSGSVTSGTHTAIQGANTADSSPITVSTTTTLSPVLGMIPSISTTVSPVTPVSRITLQRTLDILPLRKEDYSIVESGMGTKDAGANMICASYELYQLCVRPPYFARCVPDSTHNKLRYFTIAVPHEVCLALCSCVAAAIEEAEDDFQGLD